MIRRAGEMVKEVRERMRGGEGSVELLHVFKKDELKGRARLFAKITLQPGCSIGFHEHIDEEELFYILRGTGTVNDAGKEEVVKAGDAILTGGGAGHSIANTGDEPLEIMAAILLY
ncbi:MAG TPA: cupin domain-containing protein [Firmicutes bacterium]|nr:cupin domain-containing protein [Bacillota bacterium]